MGLILPLSFVIIENELRNSVSQPSYGIDIMKIDNDFYFYNAGVHWRSQPKRGYKPFYYDGKRTDKDVSWSGVFYYLSGVPENLLVYWNAIGGGWYEYKPSLTL